MTTKLTPRQQEILDFIREGGEKAMTLPHDRDEG